MAIADIPTTFICVNEQKYKKGVIFVHLTLMIPSRAIFYTYLNMNFFRCI